MGAEFDDLARGEAEEAVGGDGVLLEEGEDRLGDGPHMAFGGGDEVVTAEVVSDLVVGEGDVGFGDGGAKDGEDLGIFDEPEGDSDAVEASVQFKRCVALGFRDHGLPDGANGQQDDGFVKGMASFDVADEGEGEAIGTRGEEDGGAGDAGGEVGVDAGMGGVDRGEAARILEAE